MNYMSEYERWLASPALTAEERAELEAIRGDDEAIKDRFFAPLSFGTAGLRGVLGTMVFGVVATVIYSIAANRMEEFTRTNIGVSMYLIIALLACVAAVLGIYGDLFASVVKRQCGIKDYGTIFPGHGGILDRFDSVMFIAPFVTMVVIAAFYN